MWGDLGNHMINIITILLDMFNIFPICLHNLEYDLRKNCNHWISIWKLDYTSLFLSLLNILLKIFTWYLILKYFSQCWYQVLLGQVYPLYKNCKQTHFSALRQHFLLPHIKSMWLLAAIKGNHHPNGGSRLYLRINCTSVSTTVQEGWDWEWSK